MKYDSLIMILGTVLLTAGIVMKISEVPYATSVIIFGFIGPSLYQTWLVTKLKRRIKELEKRS